MLTHAGSSFGGPETRNEAASKAVGHVMPEYLPRASTYIYTQLRFQRDHAPVILTESAANRGEFPLDHPIVDVTGAADGGRPTTQKLRALLAGYSSPFAHAIAREAGRRELVALHAHHGWAGRPAIEAATRLDLPLVTSFYGRDLALKKGLRSLRHPYARLFEHGTLFYAEGPASAAHLESLGCPAEKIRLVRIGIDLSRFEFVPRTRAGTFVIMQVARLWEKKGVDLSIRSFAAARARLGEAELWIVGDGPLRAELEELAGRLGVEDSVRFAGELSHDEYRALATRAHAGIQPSRTAADGDTEGGAPTVLLEMQAVGIPVVATRHADIPFVVARQSSLVAEEDVDGLAEALVELAAADDADYAAIAAEGRAHVEAYHDARVVAQVIEQGYAEAIRLTSNGGPTNDA